MLSWLKNIFYPGDSEPIWIVYIISSLHLIWIVLVYFNDTTVASILINILVYYFGQDFHYLLMTTLLALIGGLQASRPVVAMLLLLPQNWLVIAAAISSLNSHSTLLITFFLWQAFWHTACISRRLSFLGLKLLYKSIMQRIKL